MNFVNAFSRYISTRLILSTLAIMVLIHLVVLSYYTQEHKSTQHIAGRDAAIQQVMNIIHMVKATPATQLDRAVKTLNMPNIDANITTTPKWDLRVTDLSFWRINHLVPRHADNIKLSLLLFDGYWLNVYANVVSDTMLSQLFLLLAEAMIAAIILFYAWSINRFTMPLKNFQRVAERLGVDVDTVPLEEVQGPTIVRQTAQAMNRMQQRIQDLLKDRTLMLAAISHDLRTPITRLRLRADLMKDSQLHGKTIHDLDEMESMISEILAYAREEHSQEDKVKLDMNSLLQSICDDLSDIQLNVHYHGCNARVPYKGRTLALKRAFMNIIQNAIKYGHVAHVTLSTKKNLITTTIDDEGPGIPEDELNQVFIPFYRCDRSRSRKLAGTGLGLTVAYEAIRAHGGKIQLSNRPEGGLRVTVELS